MQELEGVMLGKTQEFEGTTKARRVFPLIVFGCFVTKRATTIMSSPSSLYLKRRKVTATMLLSSFFRREEHRK
jgi:hypothetical protein